MARFEGNMVVANKQDMQEAIQSFNDMIQAVDDEKWIRATQRRAAKRHIVSDMKRRSHSVRIEKMISVTTAKKNNVPPFGIRVGVVRNDPSEFKQFSAQALASVIEYGTAERYRMLRSAGLITGRVSTGEMPAAPFLRPGWDNNVAAFMADVEQSIEKRVQDAA